MVQCLRDHGIENIPARLQRRSALQSDDEPRCNQHVKSLWQSPLLMLSQCCGPDLFTREGDSLEVIARPAFAELDCQPGSYFSYIVGRTEHLPPTPRIAVNALSSRSGYFALVEWLCQRGISISTVQVSGSHKNSILLLENGHADIAAIDAHTLIQSDWQLQLPVIGQSGEAPSPPFVFHRDCGIDSELMVSALEHAIRLQGTAIGINGLLPCGRQHYRDSGMHVPAAEQHVVSI
jgi:hypothetical protein